MTRTRLTFLVLIAAAICGLAAIVPSQRVDATTPSVSRVVIFSVPTLRVQDITQTDMPVMHAFLATTAFANLSTRVAGDTTTLADGYATLAAGTRTVGARRDAGLAFAADAPYGTSTAGGAYTERTGRPADGQLVYLGQPELDRANRNALFGTEIGAMADALSRAGVPRAVIANADTAPDALDRVALTGVADSAGRVPRGRVDRPLLAPDASAAYGVRLDPPAVRSVLTELGSGSGVVLVEGSDLWRAEISSAPAAARAAHQRYARKLTDEVFETVVASINPGRDALLIVGPTSGTGTTELTIAAMYAPGLTPGQLTSATTRRAGAVQLVDVAPTVLELLEVPRPASMEGRPFTVVASATASLPARLHAINDAAVFRDSVIGGVTGAWVTTQVLLCAWMIVLLRRRISARMRDITGGVALAFLGVPIMLWCVQPIPFARLGVPAFVAVVVVGAIAIAVLAWQFRRDWRDPILVLLGSTIALVAVDIATGAHLQYNSVFGYSPTIAGRFAGIGNLAYAVFGACALLFAGLICDRVPGRWGNTIAIATLGIVCVVDGAPFLGADVGGMLSLVPASAYLVWRILDRQVRIRTVVLGVVVTVLVVVSAGLLDMTRPSDSQTHLGRLFVRIRDDGWDAFATVIARKADANLRVLTMSPWVLFVPLFLVLFIVVLVRVPRSLQPLFARCAHLRSALIATAVLAGAGGILNDSGIAIPGMILCVTTSVMAFLLARIPRTEPALAASVEREVAAV